MFKRIFLSLFTFLILGSPVVYADGNNFWYPDGVSPTSLQPIDTTWNLGSTSKPIAKGFFTNLDVQGTLTFTAASTALSLSDDVPLKLGTGSDASLLFETADANAQGVLLALPEGTATESPCFVVGDQTALNADLGFNNGLTEPCIEVLDSSATRYGRLKWDGTFFTWDTGNIVHQFAFNKAVNFLSTMLFGNDANMVMGSGLYLRTATVGVDDVSYFGMPNNLPLVFTTQANTTSDFAKGVAEDDPRFYITSATAFTSNTNEWGMWMHDKSDFVVTTGTGTVKFDTGLKYKRTTSAAGNYTMLTTDFVLAKTGITIGGDTVTLPAAATAGEGRIYIIKDESGLAGARNITIDGNGAETVDGAASVAITANYGAGRLYSNGTAWFTF